MGCGRWQSRMDRLHSKMERMQEKANRWYGRQATTGNRAFDEYREETLRRLDEEQREFRDFLDRLRAAKDRSEFDQFMNERRNRPPAAEPPAPTPSA